jgi:Sulfotransferase domain
MLPNFLIIGAAKAGTTSLYHYIGGHPQAFMSEKKELSFFCEEFNWKRGLEWYESHFQGADSALAAGEASPRYTVFPLYQGVPARIASLMPDVRLIYLVREPIERMRSQYLDNVIHRLEKDPVEEALSVNPFYLTSSSYALQLQQYLEHFPREQILVVRSEDMRRERERVLSRIFAFLGIDPTWQGPVFTQEFLKMSERRAPRRFFHKVWRWRLTHAAAPLLPRSLKDRFRTMTSKAVDLQTATISPSFRRHLEGLLREDVERLYEFLDEGFDGWGIA